MQVCIHTDTLNEAGHVEDTIAAIAGRTIHTFHTEGAGGGHAPDIIRICGEANVLPSSGLWLPHPPRPPHLDSRPEPGLSPDSRSYGLLWSLAPYSQTGHGEPWQLSLQGERQETITTGAPVDHSLNLSFSLPF